MTTEKSYKVSNMRSCRYLYVVLLINTTNLQWRISIITGVIIYVGTLYICVVNDNLI